MYYIPAPAISKKLFQAARSNEVTYIKGAIGLGKTAAVKHFLRRKKAVWFDGEPGYLETMPAEILNSDEVVVVDNISCIRDYPSIEYLRKLIRRQGRQIILIGRGNLPSWLATVSTEIPFCFTSQEDLLVGRTDMEEAFPKPPWNLKKEAVERIFEEASDNPMFSSMLALRAVNGNLSDENVERARLSYYHVMDERFFEWLDQEEQTIMIALCSFDCFSLEMARSVTTNPHIESVFERLFLREDCLLKRGEEYRITEPYLSYLRWKQRLMLGYSQRKEIFRLAASYYALQDNPFMVVECYRKAEDQERVDETILRICNDFELIERNLYQVTNCMNLLTAERSYNNPLLMTTRSLLYSLEMNPGRSEDWYERLAEYAARTDLGRSERLEAEFRLAYLDLFLPHRSSTRLLERLEHYLDAKKKWNGRALHPSLTLFGPSAINGLVDLSCFIGENSEIERAQAVIREAGEKINAADAGFVELVLQELAVERGEAEESVFETRMNQIILDAERRGMEDRCLTAVVQYAKGRLVNGDADTTTKIHKRFLKKYENNLIIKKGIECLDLWISMLLGETAKVEKWLPEAPDSSVFFALTDRYEYILKARVLIMKNEHQTAMILLDRLGSVFREYHRDYMWIKAMLLKAISMYRTGSPRWKTCFLDALQHAEVFRFMRVIADEGAAAVPLFDELSSADREQFDPQWLHLTETAARNMAGYYPKYLREENEEREKLTQAEIRVLEMLCREMSSGEICEQLHISYSGLKFHKRNIYRKLGARTRNEAQQAAKEQGLVS